MAEEKKEVKKEVKKEEKVEVPEFLNRTYTDGDGKKYYWTKKVWYDRTNQSLQINKSWG